MACAGNVFLWERLGAAAPGAVPPYLAEFVTKKAPPVSTARPVRARGKSGRKPQSAPKVDLAATLEQVHAAVEAVVGHKAGDDQPLMEAGLDSLGETY